MNLTTALISLCLVWTDPCTSAEAHAIIIHDLFFSLSSLRAGTVSVRLRDSGGIHRPLRNHHNQLRAHPAAPQADQVPANHPQREAHPGHRGDVRRLLAAVPRRQHGAGVGGIGRHARSSAHVFSASSDQ